MQFCIAAIASDMNEINNSTPPFSGLRNMSGVPPAHHAFTFLSLAIAEINTVPLSEDDDEFEVFSGVETVRGEFTRVSSYPTRTATSIASNSTGMR